jgi:hypothetical protein
MIPRKKREKVVAEITTTHLMQLMQEQGRLLDQQQAVNFLNEGDRAYVMWKQMMYAGENYIKSVLVQSSETSACTLKAGPRA